MDKTKTKITRIHTHAGQFEIYVAHLEQHELLRTQGAGDPKEHAQLWETLSAELNSFGVGPRRTAREWQKVFIQWKHSIRSEARKLKRQSQQPGGGRRQLSDVKERALNLLGRAVADANDIGRVGRDACQPEPTIADHVSVCNVGAAALVDVGAATNRLQKQRRRRHEPTSDSYRKSYRMPKPSKPVNEILQKLLDTVVALTSTVTSAVDLYKQQLAATPSQRIAAPSVSADPFATTMPPGDPILISNKRRRSTVSTSDNDVDNFASDNDDDSLTYVLIPGERRSSQLMYVRDDKNLYVRRYSFHNYDRYVCKAPHCRCTVQLTKPAGIARRIGNHTFTHQHANMESEYAKMRNDHSSPAQTIRSSDVKRQTRASTSGTVVIKSEPSDKPTSSSGNTTDSEIANEEEVWTEVLAFEDGNEVSDSDESFPDSYVESATAGSSKCEDQQNDSEDDDEDTMRFEFVPGRRLQSQLLYTLDEKHLYRRTYRQPKYDRYRCITRQCRATVRYSVKENVVRNSMNKARHHHPNAEERYHANKFLNGMKEDILNSGNSGSVVQIYETHAENNAQMAQIFPLRALQGTLRKIQSRNQLRNQFDSPVTLADVAAAFQSSDIFDTFGRSLWSGGGDFYRGTVDEPTFGFCLFASATVVQHIAQTPAADRHFHVDGTANFLPTSEFKELLIVYWEHKDCIFPVVYALLTKRSKDAYIALFQYIEERICHLEPVSIMCDYEFPLRNALSRIYSHCIRWPSHFHLVQAARRHALSLPQFFDAINADARQFRVFHKLMHLPLLPAELMAQGFDLVCAEASTFGDSFGQFVDYVKLAWISNPGGPLSVMDSESASSRLVETYIAGMRAKFRPGRKFFHFVEDLAKDELHNIEQLQQLATGSTNLDTKKPKSNGIRHWHNIGKMQLKLRDGKISVAEFLQSLTNNTSALNISSESHQVELQPMDNAKDEAEDDDDMDAAEIDFALCERCGAEERRKIVLQPCGHVCHQCYEMSKPSSCPECNASVKGSIVF